jgi:hypothetical protein
MDNYIDMRAYENLKNEFNILPSHKFRVHEPWPMYVGDSKHQPGGEYNPYITNLVDEVHKNNYPYMFKSDWDSSRATYNEPYFISY